MALRLLLLVAAIRAGVDCADGAIPRPRSSQPPASWDVGLHYGALLASSAEWSAAGFELTVASLTPVLHVWTRCAALSNGSLAVRVYAAVEMGGTRGEFLHGPLLHPELRGIGGHNSPHLSGGPPLQLDGAAMACLFTAYGGHHDQRVHSSVRADCRATLSLRPKRAVAHLGVRGWAHGFDVPLRLCTPAGPTHGGGRSRGDGSASSSGDRTVVVHVYEKHGFLLPEPEAARWQDAPFVAALVAHVRSMRCSPLRPDVYELTLHERFLPLLRDSPPLAEAMASGFLQPLFKPSFPNEPLPAEPREVETAVTVEAGDDGSVRQVLLECAAWRHGEGGSFAAAGGLAPMTAPFRPASQLFDDGRLQPLHPAPLAGQRLGGVRRLRRGAPMRYSCPLVCLLPFRLVPATSSSCSVSQRRHWRR